MKHWYGTMEKKKILHSACCRCYWARLKVESLYGQICCGKHGYIWSSMNCAFWSTQKKKSELDTHCIPFKSSALMGPFHAFASLQFKYIFAKFPPKGGRNTYNDFTTIIFIKEKRYHF